MPLAVTRAMAMGRPGSTVAPVRRGSHDFRAVGKMYFPQFLTGSSLTSASIAVSTYIRTGSLWAALAWAAIGAVLLQIGYFTLVLRMVRRAEAADGTTASPEPREFKAGLSTRLLTLAAIGLLVALAMTDTTRADDDDAYFDCVIDKAEAIMKTQATKDAEKALKKAYTLCQPLAGSQDARLGSGVSPGIGQLL